MSAFDFAVRQRLLELGKASVGNLGYAQIKPFELGEATID
jgi:hypothetical protein